MTPKFTGTSTSQRGDRRTNAVGRRRFLGFLRKNRRPLLRLHSVISILRYAELRSAFRETHRPTNVVDLGAGPRPFGRHFPGSNFVSIDISITHCPDIIADIHLLPLRSKCVDLVVLGEVLEHCHSPWLVVKEARRVLVQGGMIAVTVPFLYKIHLDPGDYYRFTAEGLKHLFEDFEILKCQSFGNRVQVMFELACQGWLRYFLVWLSHPVAWLHWHDHTSPLGYMLLAKKI